MRHTPHHRLEGGQAILSGTLRQCPVCSYKQPLVPAPGGATSLVWLSADSRRLGVRRGFQKERGTSGWGPSVPSVPEPRHPPGVGREETEARLGGGMDHGLG